MLNGVDSPNRVSGSLIAVFRARRWWANSRGLRKTRASQLQEGEDRRPHSPHCNVVRRTVEVASCIAEKGGSGGGDALCMEILICSGGV